MSNMAGIVDAKSNRQDNVDAGDDVDGDVPKVEESDDVRQTERHHKNDHQTDLDVAQEEERDADDARY